MPWKLQDYNVVFFILTPFQVNQFSYFLFTWKQYKCLKPGKYSDCDNCSAAIHYFPRYNPRFYESTIKDGSDWADAITETQADALNGTEKPF